jgi:predicted Rossmann-fold nucleotide-binding protein
MFDLTTPDGFIETRNNNKAVVLFEHVSAQFLGFKIDPKLLQFNLKSILAQLGLDAALDHVEIDFGLKKIRAHVEFIPRCPLGVELLAILEKGAYVGKLFAKDPDRLVLKPDYLVRMFERSDRHGHPLLSFKERFDLQVINGQLIGFIPLLEGKVLYKESIHGLLPTIALALERKISLRHLLQLHQKRDSSLPRIVQENEILLVKTEPLYIRTVFARVKNELLPPGYIHTEASILEPTTRNSGDIYEFFGKSNQPLEQIPLEFYVLEPYKEYVFFSDRDKLQALLANDRNVFEAFKNAPGLKSNKAATFVVSSKQMQNLTAKDWIVKDYFIESIPTVEMSPSDSIMIQNYILNQPETYFLNRIDWEEFTSEGVLFCRHFPTYFLKRLFLSDRTKKQIKRLYFQFASRSSDQFFTHEDRTFMIDLYRLGIEIHWVDLVTKKCLQFIERLGRYTGMFVPKERVQEFLKATFFGVYGSNLKGSDFEQELTLLLKGILEMRASCSHPLLNPTTQIALVTGGGPGVMEVGNRAAKSLGILSCANIVDFSLKTGGYVNEQAINTFIDAKMTYRIDKLVERQAEFYLDFPIFLEGGIGTDFEYSLEEVRRKVNSVPPYPVILFGSPHYWEMKITNRFTINLQSGTIKGSEWISNCFYVVENHKEAIEVYRRFFSDTLPIGPNFPPYEKGFVRGCDLSRTCDLGTT